MQPSHHIPRASIEYAHPGDFRFVAFVLSFVVYFRLSVAFLFMSFVFLVVMLTIY